MASIRKYRDKWRAEVQRHGQRASHVAETKRECQAWALKKEAELDALKGSGGKTLGDAVATYLRTVSPTKAKPDWERKRFTAFMKHFGEDTRLVDITSAEIGLWRDKRLEGDPAANVKPVTGATILRDSNLLRNLFTVARDEWKWIDHNPFRGVRLPEQADSRKAVWGWKQIRRVLRADRQGKTAQVIRAFHIALHTGLRLSEIVTGVYDPKRRVMTLATSKGSRLKPVDVPMPRRAAKLLPFAFTVGANEASTLFADLRKDLLIKGLTFHDTRATALTLLSRRMDVLTLARVSRHKNLNLLLSTYYRESAADISARI
ncbi:hypothetical protein GN316_15235 [Xylophilus sp. Kf1]|nr:hypothetical protein [Xylophilus sp. Kf1]